MSASFIGTIQKYIASIVPWWLAGPNVGRFIEAEAATLDLSGDALAQGLMQSQPLRCDSSVLPIIAKDRRMKLYPTEGEASQRTRLSQWKQLHRQRGTHQGELRHVAPYFKSYPVTPTMRIVHQSGSGARATWHTLVGSAGGASFGNFSMSAKEPSNWNWDDAPTKRSRFWLIIYTSGLGFAPSTWDGGETWDGSAIWDGLFTAAQIADLVAMVTDWKSAHSKLWGVIAATDPASFDPAAPIVVNGDGTSTLPNGKWGAAIDHTTGFPTRLSTARFLYDLGQG